jgi:hypothetical protein
MWSVPSLIGRSLVGAAMHLTRLGLSATREGCAKPVSSGLGAPVGAVGMVFLVVNIAS